MLYEYICQISVDLKYQEDYLNKLNKINQSVK